MSHVAAEASTTFAPENTKRVFPLLVPWDPVHQAEGRGSLLQSVPWGLSLLSDIIKTCLEEGPGGRACAGAGGEQGARCAEGQLRPVWGSENLPSTRQLGFRPPAHASVSCGASLGLGAELSHLPGMSSPAFLHTCYSKYCINMGPLRGRFVLDFET